MADKIGQLVEKIGQGNRLSAADYLNFYETADLHTLAALADKIRTALHGRKGFYIRNCHINYTNICIGNCPICTFSRHPDAQDAFALTIDEVRKTAEAAAARGVIEFHVVGGLNPDLRYDYYIDLVKTIRSVAPKAAIKAFTAVEIDYIAKSAEKPVEKVLVDFKSAGLNCLPGGGAEIFSQAYRQKHFPNKISADRWLDIHRIAHSLKIPTTATMLYNNSETPAERIEHLLKLRDTQDESMRDYGTGFICFVPLSCKSENNLAASAVLDIRTIAVSRIILDNIPHIKAFWPILGWDVAQVALLSGADDLDGAIDHYKIVETSSDGSDIQRMIDAISQIGLVPVQRNSFYD
jgi:aminodeoxyfutalosine synthase